MKSFSVFILFKFYFLFSGPVIPEWAATPINSDTLNISWGLRLNSSLINDGMLHVIEYRKHGIYNPLIFIICLLLQIIYFSIEITCWYLPILQILFEFLK